jgi:hypothetical protein
MIMGKGSKVPLHLVAAVWYGFITAIGLPLVFAEAWGHDQQHRVCCCTDAAVVPAGLSLEPSNCNPDAATMGADNCYLAIAYVPSEPHGTPLAHSAPAPPGESFT